MNIRPLVLLVDDETSILHTLKAILEDEQFAVEVIDNGSKVIDAVGKLIPDVVLLDIFLPNYNGLALLEQIKREFPAQDVIMISGFGTIPIATQAVRAGARDFIEKPLNLDDVLAKLDYLKQPAPILAPLPQTNLIGQSALFKELTSALTLVAPLQTPLIIYGPAGSGKSLMAAHAHNHSALAHQPFITIDATHISNFDGPELAAPGSLFIKNIHALAPAGQRSLLDFIQSHPSVRIIASSLPGLFKQAQEGTFNMQLFCILNSTPLEIASINKRRYDIPLLVNTFLQQANNASNKTVHLSPCAIRTLCGHSWAGDVAQIKKFIGDLVEAVSANSVITQNTISNNLNIAASLVLIAADHKKTTASHSLPLPA